MAYEYFIASMSDDFYMADAICRELERHGKKCFFNWRDSKHPEKLDAFTLAKADNYILIVNKTSLNWSYYKDSMNQRAGLAEGEDGLWKNIVFLNEDIEALPKAWGTMHVFNAQKGLTSGMIFSMVGKVSIPVWTIRNAKEKYLAKDDSALETDLTAPSEQEISKTTNIQKKMPKQPSSKKPCADWKTVTRNKIAKLQTVMTAAPTMENEFEWTSQSRKDLVGEAYLVPLYVLPFERAEKVPFLNDLFKSIPEPGMTLMRAFRYLTGEGVPKDEKRATTLAQKAVSENPNDGVAQYCLGTFYEYGIGCNTDFAKAKELYANATNLGISAAKTRLVAMAYQSEDSLESIKDLLTETRMEGDLEASYLLGIIAEDNGNLADAFEFYSEAAEMGHAKAQNAIATMYYNGTYVPQDIAQAEEWCNLSAEQGFEGACYNQVVLNLNQINKSRPDNGLLTSLVRQYKSLGISATKYPTFPAVNYNIGILYRRDCQVLDIVDTWIGDENLRTVVPYANEFYAKLAEEESRMKRKAAGITVLNGINNLLAGISGEKRTDADGGLFDKYSKDMLGRGK